jgi:hypothetical protein
MCLLAGLAPQHVAITDQARIADADKVGIETVRVRAMQTISENPREVVPVGDPENESPVRAEYVPQWRRSHPKGAPVTWRCRSSSNFIGFM